MRRFDLASGPAGGRRAACTRMLIATVFAASLALPFLGGTPTPVSAADDGLIHLALKPGESEARYIVTVKTLGQAPKPAACTTRDVTGEIVLAPDGSVVTDLSKILIDQRTLKCQAPLRDSNLQNLLQTAQHPMAELQIKSAPGLGVPLPSGDTAFQLAGDQNVRGVTQPTVYDTTANLTPDAMVGLARTAFKMTSFGITPPSIGPLIQVSDDMVAEVDLKASVSSVGAAAAPAQSAPPASDPAPGGDEDAPAEGTP